ncbi:MAG: zinc ribbon domain-containing protein [Blastocatellia bacterium]|nr:zinc ribbon domain-containing protein [Blastocatellia bacterium]
MFCPKCGNEALENQKFCKACGTNLHLIYGALESEGSGKGPFGIDVESLAKQAKEFADSWKTGWGGSGMAVVHTHHRATKPVEKKVEQKEQQRMPKPKEWLPYSWQHNLKHGLISLFSGAGFGALLYYLGRTAIEAGTVKSIEEAAGRTINGLEQLLAIIWLLAAIPVLKGIAQIIYAAFFAESMTTLADRFVPKSSTERNTAPQAVEDVPPSFRSALEEPPPSVTEHTTKIFENSQPAAERETQ